MYDLISYLSFLLFLFYFYIVTILPSRFFTLSRLCPALTAIVPLSTPYSLLARSVCFSTFSAFLISTRLFSKPQVKMHHPSQDAEGIASGVDNGKTTKKHCTLRWNSKNVRSTFVKFFETEHHTEWQSSPVVPHNDATLLFVNAGMNQFKPLFLGRVDPHTTMAKLKRATNSQKCIRAGGKHNDLDDVGTDVYHHTFFEMMGSWSFGDYFKKEAIDFAWKLLVDTYGIDSSRLYATYFGGDPKVPNCPPDEEAKQLWLQYLPESRILPFGTEDNFWEMAETGPCGPCSEIHYDRIGNRDASSLVNADNPDVLEIWNLVFMQFNREMGGRLSPLPAPCVDTGLGLERLTSILQGVESNYDTDLFIPLFEMIESLLNVPTPYSGKVGAEDSNRIDMTYRVIADHIRCLSIAIADGAEPSNEGRGYVLRRILRRALRYGRHYFAAPANEGWLYKLVDGVISTLGLAYPGLLVNADRIKEIIKEEETLFSKTLDKGMDHFKKCLQRIASKGEDSSIFSGKEAFTLYATYGFPLDLTEVMAREIGMTVNVIEFNEKFKEHQLVSENKAFKGTDSIPGPDQLHELKERCKFLETEDSSKYQCHIRGEGYGQRGQLLVIWDGSEFLNSLSTEMAQATLIFDKTNFYAEQGGQIYDTGSVSNESNEDLFEIDNVQKVGNYIFHSGKLRKGTLTVKEEMILLPDFKRRYSIEKNHTATHLLNFALRKVLDATCDQRGSLVEPNRLRFDFEYFKQISNAEMKEIETNLARLVTDAMTVYTKNVSLLQGRNIEGLRAVFGETYPDPVRVVSVGVDIDTILEVPKAGYGFNYSVEFCGGTHVDTTDEIQECLLVQEESISKGVRRIVAVTGEGAQRSREAADSFQTELHAVEAAMEAQGQVEALLSDLRVRIDENKMLPYFQKKFLVASIEDLVKKQLEKSKTETKALLKIAQHLGELLAKQKKEETFVIHSFPELKGDGKALDTAIQIFRNHAPNVAVFFLSASHDKTGTSAKGNKLSAIAMIPEALQGKLSAADWLIEALKVANGKGGGSRLRAVGAGRNSEQVEEVLEEAYRYLTQYLQ
ncbi:cytosolic tRna-Ala synthetase [Cardiosporidium cionae]|uniref:Alanine--tRNA ligase n=1 Tax=Cardiosporidium cionae TaxID=476202 RepID=A0ABQ7JBL1_9APIC|nr:cytosolic tRna-Ala synthetase [Cardiosporidium cionae]|eukprot:KAF8821391.1 cytosolic tRna-Ala synthetase [Cardiosporidium cionae]